MDIICDLIFVVWNLSFRCRVLGYAAVLERYGPGAVGRGHLIMGHHDDRLAFPVEAGEQQENVFAGARIEVSRGFVGQEHGRVCDERARNGHALHLTARELLGPVFDPLTETDFMQQRFRFGFDLCERDALKQKGKAHILRRGQNGQKVEELEDEANAPPPDKRELVVGDSVKRYPVNEDLSETRLVQASDKVQESALARSGGPHDGQKFTGPYAERDIAQSVDIFYAVPVGSRHTLQFYHASPHEINFSGSIMVCKGIFVLPQTKQAAITVFTRKLFCGITYSRYRLFSR